MASDWLNWQQFYAANQPEAQRESQEEADKYSQASRNVDAVATAAMRGGSVDPSAYTAQVQNGRGEMRQTGMSTPWENALYGSPDTQLNYGDAWGQLGSRLAGIQAQRQAHDRAQQQLNANKPTITVRPPSPGAPPPDVAGAQRQQQWNERNPYERRPGESYADYSDRIARGG